MQELAVNQSRSDKDFDYESPEWELVTRIVSSRSFEKTPRLGSLLIYICRHALSGKGTLHEQEIGVRVFGKPDGYDTSTENIVRVCVSQLRKKLALFFATEGKDTPLVLEIPLGKYEPVFKPRNRNKEGLPRGKAESAAPEAAWWRKSFPTSLGIILLSGLAVSAFLLWKENQQLKKEMLPLTTLDISMQRLWSSVFNPSQRTDIVVADSALALIQDLTGDTVSLDEYVQGLHFEKLAKSQAGNLARPLTDRLSFRTFTSDANVHLALRIALLNRHLWKRGSVRSARTLGTRDFNSDNFVLLGSRRSNPWIALFEPLMNFRVEFDNGEPGPYIVNLSPMQGEEAVYKCAAYGQPQDNLYAVIALLPNLQRSGNVLIIAGSSMEATEAAGDFLTRDSLSASFLREIGLKERNSPRYFEAVVHARFAAGAGINPKVIAYRIIRAADEQH